MYLCLDRGEGREKEKERNINWLLLLLTPHPHLGTGPQPWHVPWPRIKLVAFWFRLLHNPLSHTSQDVLHCLQMLTWHRIGCSARTMNVSTLLAERANSIWAVTFLTKHVPRNYKGQIEISNWARATCKVLKLLATLGGVWGRICVFQRPISPRTWLQDKRMWWKTSGVPMLHLWLVVQPRGREQITCSTFTWPTVIHF